MALGRRAYTTDINGPLDYRLIQRHKDNSRHFVGPRRQRVGEPSPMRSHLTPAICLMSISFFPLLYNVLTEAFPRGLPVFHEASKLKHAGVFLRGCLLGLTAKSLWLPISLCFGTPNSGAASNNVREPCDYMQGVGRGFPRSPKHKWAYTSS